jgi:hypothetical protein
LGQTKRAWSKEQGVKSRERGASSGENRAKILGQRDGNYSFRFENMEVWKRAIDIGKRLFNIANELEFTKARKDIVI